MMSAHEKHLRIIVYSHHFCCDTLSARGKQLCVKFSGRFIQWGWVPENGRQIHKALKVFAASTADRTEFRFHINSYKQFMELLHNNQVDSKLYTIVEAPKFESETIDLVLNPKYKLYDYQIDAVDYLCKDEPIDKFVGLRTGLGKGVVTLAALAVRKKRFVVVIKPGYIEKWKEELIEKCNIELDDILVVQGSDQLLKLLELAKHDKITEKVIIISNRTYQNWIKLYEKFHYELLDLGYEFVPQEFYQAVKAGVRVTDEKHQDYHLGWKIDMYTHVDQAISLSATLETYDPFITSMYSIMHPMHTRHANIETEKYIESYAVLFRFTQPDKIRTMEYGSKNYSHNAVESCIMRHIPTLKNYLNLIDYTLNIGFMQVKRSKKKCLIFAYTKEMCTLIIDHLKRKYPHLDIRRYVGEDPWENLMDGEIVVSTLGSAGTAVDIPNLTNVILTTSINSLQSNKQSFGRLRELKVDNFPPQFHYFVMTDVPKSMEYHQNKKELFGKIAKTFREYHTGIVV